MTTINEFAVVGVVDEGNTRFLQFEIDTNFDPEASEFHISVSDENYAELFHGNVNENYFKLWGNSGYGSIDLISGDRYSVKFELPDGFEFPAVPIGTIQIGASDQRFGNYDSVSLRLQDGSLPGGGSLTLNGVSGSGSNLSYSGPAVHSLQIDEYDRRDSNDKEVYLSGEISEGATSINHINSGSTDSFTFSQIVDRSCDFLFFRCEHYFEFC